MSRRAIVIASVIVSAAVVVSVWAIENDPLGVLLAAVVAFAALLALIVVYTWDAITRTTRKTRATKP